MIPAEFIDTYMADANGDFVKVYLCLLQNGDAGIEEIAEKLMLTEGDVKRAIRYWQEKSVLVRKTAVTSRKRSVQETEKEPAVPAAAMTAGEEKNLREKYRGVGCTEILGRLSEDPEFKELLLISQTYLARPLTEKDTQVFAYLYDGLKLSSDVLDFLVAYCVEHGRTDLRYMEKLGTDWAEVGVKDAKAARRRTRQFEEGKKTGKNTVTAEKCAEKGAGGKTAVPGRTDYNELVLRELKQKMGN